MTRRYFVTHIVPGDNNTLRTRIEWLNPAAVHVPLWRRVANRVVTFVNNTKDRP